MNQYKRAGIVACSNGLPASAKEDMKQLKELMEKQGMELIFSDYLYARDGIRSGTGMERANTLMKFYCDDSVDVIFDVSGGDVAQEVLEHLDYERIAKAKNREGRAKEFWGYSDLTVLLNAIYERTGNVGVLYQIRHIGNVLNLFEPEYHFLRGTEMSGIVVGGNVRCLLKLAGTKYFPDTTNKILFLEARSGREQEMRHYLSTLQQMGVFEKINGLILGTFTQWEREISKLDATQFGDGMCVGGMTMEKLVLEYVPNHLPIAKTYEVGHASDSKAIYIGKYLNLT